MSVPVLALPDFNKNFLIEADACDQGIGVVLMQDQRPIAFLSKTLSPRNQGLSVYEKKFLAILHAVHKWKHYLIGHHFIIKNDHQSLKHILEQKVDNALQQKWIPKLSCDVCQRSKAEHMPYPGLLQPLAFPNQIWASITMDFIEGLPKSEGKDGIFVVENYSEAEAEATWEDNYDIVSKFLDFEMDPQRRGSNLPGSNVMTIAGGRRQNLHRSPSSKFDRQIEGLEVAPDDVVSVNQGIPLTLYDIISAKGPLTIE
ncbi:hypothetical protein Sango_2051200 [Sesamum angolense]|uniref:Reverse transcriptase RNase H-like domain-containing protein n=1 Tax=Sesamum angolense TaxID=2727404 RepID=A0AAE2BPD1_9LAMI|nr:hypothetical protein Sango_2051200 [Sesamum angolense]